MRRSVLIFHPPERDPNQDPDERFGDRALAGVTDADADRNGREEHDLFSRCHEPSSLAASFLAALLYSTMVGAEMNWPATSGKY